MSEWISVKDRMPDENSRYVVALDCNEIPWIVWYIESRWEDIYD